MSDTVTMQAVNDESKLADCCLSQARALCVDIRNNDPQQSQDVELRVIAPAGKLGTPDADLLQVLPSDVQRLRLAPLETKTFAVKLNTDISLSPGSYEIVLLAEGSNGDVARRKLTIQVAATASPALQPGQPSILLDQTDAFTTTGINYLPSIMNPLLPFLFGLGFTLLLLCWLGGLLPDGLRNAVPFASTHPALFSRARALAGIAGGLLMLGSGVITLIAGRPASDFGLSYVRVNTTALPIERSSNWKLPIMPRNWRLKAFSVMVRVS